MKKLLTVAESAHELGLKPGTWGGPVLHKMRFDPPGEWNKSLDPFRALEILTVDTCWHHFCPPHW